MIKKISLGLLLLGWGVSATAQHFPDTLMRTVLEHNPALKVARAQKEASILAAGTGNTLYNPSFEFDYLFGTPKEIGNKVNLRLNQSFDFPTSYLHRTRLRDLKTKQAELDYVLVRQEILLKARLLWLEQVFLREQSSLFQQRLGKAKQLLDYYRTQLELGECDQLTYSQAVLQYTVLEGQADQVKSSILQNHQALKELCGGFEISENASMLPLSHTIRADSLRMAYKEAPGILRYQEELRIREGRKKLIRSETLPQFSAGYFSEALMNRQFQGLQLGMSIPLWENKGRVKQAISEIELAGARLEGYALEQERRLEQQLTEANSLDQRIRQLEVALESTHGLDMLDAALKSGEISAADYYYSSDFYFRNQLLLLNYKQERLTLEAELYKIFL